MTTERRFVLGNWKSNTNRAEARAMAESLAGRADSAVFVGVAPPFPWLADVSAILQDSAVATGAQNCSAFGNGAYTGEVSVDMLAEICSFILIGHSERRALLSESNDIVRAKLGRVVASNLIPVLCVGETLTQRSTGNAEVAVGIQLESALSAIEPGTVDNLIVAYEPVWAIGTGLAATVDDADAMATFIRSEATRIGFAPFPVLYGGSVNAGSAAELIAAECVSGFLVGGSSLRQDEFRQIIDVAIA